MWTEGSRCFVRDLGSSNGTFVNGQRVDRLQSEGVELFSGDYIQFGEDVDDNYCVRATVRLLPDEMEERESGSRTETPLIPGAGTHFLKSILHTFYFQLNTYAAEKEATMMNLTSTTATKKAKPRLLTLTPEDTKEH